MELLKQHNICVLNALKFIKLKKVYGEGAEDGKQGMPSLKKLEHLINYRPKTKLDEILNIILKTKNI